MAKFQPNVFTMFVIFSLFFQILSEPNNNPALTRSKSVMGLNEAGPVLTRSKSAPTPVLKRSKSINFLKLDSVTSFDGLEDLYLLKRQQKIDTTTLQLMTLSSQLQRGTLTAAPLMDKHFKWSICKSIFIQSQYISASEEQLIYPKTAKDDLKNKDRYIFHDNFEKKLSITSRGPWKRSRYVNRSKLRTIVVRGNDFPEMTFACVVWNRQEKIFKQYFVSDSAYNVNEVKDGDYIGARFVFAYNPDKMLVVHGLAEEPADVPVLRKFELESLYLQKRKKRFPTVEAKNDPVCRLDNSQKFRLCNSTSSKFRSFWQFKIRTKISCQKRDRVSLTNESVRVRAGNIHYEEWMVACEVTVQTNNGQSSSITYYVSRGYENNEVFIFGDQRGLEYYGRRVSVVSDQDYPGIPEEDEEVT